jgi:hypothetical protein
MHHNGLAKPCTVGFSLCYGYTNGEFMKYLMFKDKEPQIDQDTEIYFTAVGIVESISHEKNKPSESGKDVCVMSLNPLTLDIDVEWRAWGEIEVKEVESFVYDYLKSKIERMRG